MLVCRIFWNILLHVSYLHILALQHLWIHPFTVWYLLYRSLLSRWDIERLLAVKSAPNKPQTGCSLNQTPEAEGRKFVREGRSATYTSQPPIHLPNHKSNSSHVKFVIDSKWERFDTMARNNSCLLRLFLAPDTLAKLGLNKASKPVDSVPTA